MKSKKLNYEALTSVIPYGKENAISQKELANRLNVTENEARTMIQNIKGQIPICSIPGFLGYFFTNNPDDMQKCINAFEHRKRANEKAMKPIRDELKRVNEQQKKGDNSHDK